MTLPPGVRPPEHRVDQYCDGCGGLDTHPRHHFLGGDGTYTRKHFDCCHNAGCPDGSCTEHLRASGQQHGDNLVAYLQSPAGKQVIDRLNARVGRLS